MKRLTATLGLLLLAVPAALAAAQIEPELQAALDAAAPGEAIAVLVRFDASHAPGERALDGARRRAGRADLVRSLQRTAQVAQRPARTFLRERGFEPVSLWIVNAMAVKVPADVVRRLIAFPGVARVSLDRIVREPQLGGASNGVSAAPAEWNIDRVHAPALWSLGLDGAGMVVGTMDSGVDAAQIDLSGRRRSTASWFDPNGQHAAPYDATGHGTNVLGVLVGGDAGGSSIGVAPGATWIAAKIFNDAGSAAFSVIHQGFQWMLDPDGDLCTDDAADVVNNSWGLRDNVDQCILEFEDDIVALKAAGIAVVFSGGNEGATGASTSLSPANNAAGFAVGATDIADTIGNFSSRGPSACGGALFPEIVAPGVDIWTSDLTGGGTFPDSYVAVDGTSFAAPHVSGGVALLAQAFPEATVEEIETAITATALDLGASSADNTYGNGLIDLSAARAFLAGTTCTDGDGDLRDAQGVCPGAIDCNDADGDVWSAPGEVGTVAFAADGATLQWSVPLDPGGTAGSLVYDTVRSSDPADFISAAVCVESDDGADSIAFDGEVPAPGAAFYYLVRAENACPSGEGRLGRDAFCAERLARSCSP